MVLTGKRSQERQKDHKGSSLSISCNAHELVDEHRTSLTRRRSDNMSGSASRDRSSSQSGPSDTGHQTIHKTRVSQVMTVGQWATEKTLGLDMASAPIGNRGPPRRTGTDIQQEEETVGSGVHSRAASHHDPSGSQAGEIHQPQIIVSTEDQMTAKERTPDFGYYHFEWFWILIAMILSLVCGTIIYLLVTFGNIISSLARMFAVLGVGTAAVFIYTGSFVLLTKYHEVLGKAIARYTHIRRHLQRICLRICAYLYFFCTIGVLVFILMVF